MNGHLESYQHHGMVCEKCGKISPGRWHTFWYGRSHLQSADALSRTYRIQTGGSRSAYICERCTRKAIVLHPQLWFLVAAPLFVYFSLTIRYGRGAPLGTVMGWTLMMYFWLYLVSGPSKYHILEFWYGAGARQAIRAYKKGLKAQGYHLFWTPGQYEKRMSRKP